MNCIQREMKTREKCPAESVVFENAERGRREGGKRTMREDHDIPFPDPFMQIVGMNRSDLLNHTVYTGRHLLHTLAPRTPKLSIASALPPLPLH